MPTLQNILNIIDEIAPFSLAEKWDNSGLQIGSLSQEIKKIYIALDPTLEALLKAHESGAQLLFTHHPLIFKPLIKINQEEYPGNVIYKASRAGISLVAAHTNLDVSIGGINDILADLLNLQDIKVLEKHSSDSDEVGAGRIGTLTTPLKFCRVIDIVKESLDINNIMVSGQEERLIKKIAVVGGSGGDTITSALLQGADLLITGDIKHHNAIDAEASGLALIDAGHFNTERIALRIFSNILENKIIEKGWNVVLEFHGTEQNPMRFE